MAGHTTSETKASRFGVTTEAELTEWLVRAWRYRVTSRAVVDLVASRTAISTHLGLATVVLVAPTEHVIAWAHHLVTLKTRVARVATQVLMAVFAIGIFIPRLLGVVAAKLNVVILWQGSTGEVCPRRIALHHALMTNVATSNTNALWGTLRILVALCALLHLRHTDVFDLIGCRHIRMTGFAANGGSRSILYMGAMREGKPFGNHDSSLGNIYVGLLMTTRAIRHAHDFLCLAFVAANT